MFFSLPPTQKNQPLLPGEWKLVPEEYRVSDWDEELQKKFISLIDKHNKDWTKISDELANGWDADKCQNIWQCKANNFFYTVQHDTKNYFKWTNVADMSLTVFVSSVIGQKKPWEKIAAKMMNLRDEAITPVQCSHRWSTLKRKKLSCKKKAFTSMSRKKSIQESEKPIKKIKIATNNPSLIDINNLAMASVEEVIELFKF